MTDKTTEADRKAAAACYDELTGTPGRTSHDEMAGDWLARRFAAHREELRAENERLREALAPFARTDVIEPYGYITGLERYDFDRARAALASKGGGGQWRHKKRGTTYHKIGVAELQVANERYRPGEGDGLVIYRGEDGKLWARLADEFHDGRFEMVTDQ